MWVIFKTEVLIYQSEANLDVKILIGKSSKNSKNACKGFVCESRNQHSILVHDLRSIAVYIVGFRNRILISIAIKSWTRMEYEILVPKHALY